MQELSSVVWVVFGVYQGLGTGQPLVYLIVCIHCWCRQRLAAGRWQLLERSKWTLHGRCCKQNERAHFWALLVQLQVCLRLTGAVGVLLSSCCVKAIALASPGSNLKCVLLGWYVV